MTRSCCIRASALIADQQLLLAKYGKLKRNQLYQAYNGFNLIVGDLKTRKLAYITNRGKDEALEQPQELAPGVYGISNGVLGDKWTKVLWTSTTP